MHRRRPDDRGHQRRGDARPVGVPDRRRRRARRSATTCTSPAGCCTASPRTTTSSSASPPSRRRATGTAPARTPTSRPRRCARATTPIERGVQGDRQEARRCTSRTTAHDIESRLTGAHETAPCNKFSYGVSNRGASSASRGRSPRTARATPRTAARTPTCDPYTVTRLIIESVCRGSIADPMAAGSRACRGPLSCTCPTDADDRPDWRGDRDARPTTRLRAAHGGGARRPARSACGSPTCSAT